MSSFSHSRAWEAPVATALSIRCTANLMGKSGDNFMKESFLSPNAVVPTAPKVEAGALPIPAHAETATGSEADQRTWEGPIVTTLII